MSVRHTVQYQEKIKDGVPVKAELQSVGGSYRVVVYTDNGDGYVRACAVPVDPSRSVTPDAIVASLDHLEGARPRAIDLAMKVREQCGRKEPETTVFDWRRTREPSLA